jgi:hypothetical protein
MEVLGYDSKVGIPDADSEHLIARVLCWVLHIFRLIAPATVRFKKFMQRTLCHALHFCHLRIKVFAKSPPMEMPATLLAGAEKDRRTQRVLNIHCYGFVVAR